MDSELLKLIEKAVNDGLTTAAWYVIVISVTAAGVGAFLGSYFRRKGENIATKEDFDQLLNQLKNQTKATEEIKAEIQVDLNRFSDTLERNREFTGFRRDRIAEHLNIILDAYIELYSIAQMIPLRLWLHSNTDLETEGRFRAALSRLRVHFGTLECLGVLPDEIIRTFMESDRRVLDSWNDVMSEAAYRTPEYKNEFPNGTAFSGERYYKRWMKFMTTIEDLGKVVKGLSRDIVLPL
ncbi:hypothetical protein [Hydrogenimonas sp.]